MFRRSWALKLPHLEASLRALYLGASGAKGDWIVGEKRFMRLGPRVVSFAYLSLLHPIPPVRTFNPKTHLSSVKFQYPL